MKPCPMSRRRSRADAFGLALLAALCTYAVPALAAEVVVREAIAYKSGSHLSDYERERCTLDLCLPEGESDFPVLFWFHGGGLTAGDKAEATQAGIAGSPTARGIAVASVNYRLSPRRFVLRHL